VEKPCSHITAVVLAGGKNTRFGGADKAFAMIGNVPMVEIVTGRLGEIFKNILVITNSPEKYEAYSGITLIADIFKGAGPLGGIHAAMKNAVTPFIFVVSCDMPFLDTGLIMAQIDFFGSHQKVDALMPRIGSDIEPLHTIYSTSLAESLEEFLVMSPDYSIRAFLKDREVVYFDLPAGPRQKKAFSNINIIRDIPGGSHA
jgi:molybdopterin-guanine dinucleotide biosynthesis protein A